MAELQKKRHDLNLKEKLDILERYDKLPKMSQRNAAAQLKISQPLLCKILKNRDTILKAQQQNENLKCKRNRSGKDGQVESALKLWFTNVREQDAHVDGPLMRQKAEELAKKMGKDFVATDGWFQRWKKRENIVYKRMHVNMERLVLGLDIGTTSVKVCLVDIKERKVVARQSKDTQASVPSELGCEGNKQNAPKIISAVHICVSRLPKELLRQVECIGVCGQMHGVMLWQYENSPPWVRADIESSRYEVMSSQVSSLYTWQDSRCDPSFLESLPRPESHLRAYSGYGCNTLFWIAKNRPEKLSHFNCAGTVQDFMVAMLCNLKRPVMSIQNAASWGYFDTESCSWNKTLLESAGFPIHLLPDVVQSKKVVGQLTEQWHGIPAGTPVGAALGDLQCSVLSTLKNFDDAVLNLSTSAQLGFVATDFKTAERDKTSPVEYFPYFDGQYLAVATSLNGGNALATFVKMLQQWTLELGFNVPQSTVWSRLLELGASSSTESTLCVVPTLLGERHSPQQNASISNIDPGNLSLGLVFKAICQGIIHNLHSMMPREMLIKANISRILGIGSALTRNEVLQKEVHQCYQLPVVFVPGGEAAWGAAMAVMDNCSD